MTWQSAPSSDSAISMTPGIVYELHEVRVAIERIVDRPVEEAVLGGAIVALGQRLQPLHVPAQLCDLIAVEHPGEVHVPVLLDSVDLTRQVRLGHQRQGFRHHSQSTVIEAELAAAHRCLRCIAPDGSNVLSK